MGRFSAGIVTYQPELNRLEENIKRVINQVEKVYIVDNGSSDIVDIRAIVNKYNTLTLIENNQNYGIAKALNQLCGRALDDGFEWIITLDQDSVLPTDLIDNFSFYTKDDSIGIVCPAVYYEGREKEKRGKTETDYVYACMTSASLTRLDAWKKVKGFRDEFFIDYVDNEFCMKLKLNGYRILRVNKCMMYHQLGTTFKKKLLGIIPLRYTTHSPLRLYYMIRNNYVFIHEYKNNLPYFKEWMKLIYILVKSLLFTNEKKESFSYVLKAIRDARNMQLGMYDE